MRKTSSKPRDNDKHGLKAGMSQSGTNTNRKGSISEDPVSLDSEHRELGQHSLALQILRSHGEDSWLPWTAERRELAEASKLRGVMSEKGQDTVPE